MARRRSDAGRSITRATAALSFVAVFLAGCADQTPDRRSAAEPATQPNGRSASAQRVEASHPVITRDPADRPPKPRAGSSPTSTPSPSPRPTRTYLVSRVIDGDTIELANEETVRLIGVDTPERGECGYERATTNTERLVLGKRVRLTVSDENRDRYGRLLRYVDVGGQDVGLRLIKNGNAIARYDSRDGYGHHPREERYIAADRASKGFRCAGPAPAQQSLTGCAPGYSPCIPPYPPDLDCADVDGPVYVTGSDPHGLDANGDGVGCE